MHTLLHDDDIGANHGILIGDIILRINIFSDDSTGFSWELLDSMSLKCSMSL